MIRDGLLASVIRRLDEGKSVRRRIADGGRLSIDRVLPFLCVYRQPQGDPDPGTARLVTAEASFLVAASSQDGLAEFAAGLVESMSAKFGAFLIVELWAKADSEAEADHRAIDVAPVFEVYGPGANRLDSTLQVLVRQLRKLRVQKQRVEVEVMRSRSNSGFPEGRAPLIDAATAKRLNCLSIGIAVPPFYRDEVGDPEREYPQLLKQLRRRIGLALRRTFFEFATRLTTHRPPHFHQLGRRAVVKAVWEVDAQLAEVAERFDYLLNVTPINTRVAWQEFRDTDYSEPPEFHYLPLSFDPALLKRELYRIPIERVEDPALATLFLEKQAEVDRKITMLVDRNTPAFLFGSLQLHGRVGGALFAMADEILEQNPRAAEPQVEGDAVDAEAFAQAARAEIGRYREIDASFEASVEVTKKVAGVMVSGGRLLVSDAFRTAADSVDALIQHEVGVHLVTYHNGRAQPFRQLAAGLAGYEVLQEGLAVFGEYLVGRLPRPRLRQLAGRVIAAKQLEDGAEFLDNFRVLTEDYGFRRQAAFQIAMRVHRGGGFMKDAIYLRGFEEVIELVQSGIDLDLLLYGKVAGRHINVVRELRLREVLKPLTTRPLFLSRPVCRERLDAVQDSGATLQQLVGSSHPTSALGLEGMALDERGGDGSVAPERTARERQIGKGSGSSCA